jgi:hypothetical protein
VSTQVHTKPASVEQGPNETLPWRFDLAPLLGAGETASTPSARLTNLRTGADYAAGLDGAPSLDGIYLTQSVTDLVSGTTYRLSVGFTAEPLGAIWELLLDIVCV